MTNPPNPQWQQPQPPYSPYPPQPGGYGQYPPPVPQQQPPRRTGGTIALVLLAVLLVAGLAGAALFVFTRDSDTGPTAAAASPASAASPEATESGATATGATCADPGDGGTARPSGASYSFTVPDCFVEVDNAEIGRRVGSSNLTYSTALAPTDRTTAANASPYDNITVGEFDLGFDTTPAKDSEIEAAVTKVAEEMGDPSGSPQPRTVSGARGYGQEIEMPEATAMAWLFFKGEHETQVLCQWKDDERAELIRAGCEQILATLSID